jgi:hypothetical protein
MIPLSTMPKPTNGKAATRKSRVAWLRVSGVSAAVWLPAEVQAASLAAASLPASAAAASTFLAPVNENIE